MRHCVRIAGVTLAAAALGILQGCATPPQGAAPAARDNNVEVARIARDFRDIALMSGVPSECKDRIEINPPGPPHSGWRRCYVQVTITPYVSGGVEYCLAQVGNVEFADRPKNKLVVFELKAASGSGRYVFHDPDGILLFTNAGGKVTKGGRGNGDRSSEASFFLKNTHGSRGEALFLPVILQVDRTTGDPLSVCAAADPKIINN
jgi:hypothetical protein